MTKCCTCLPVYEDYDEHNESHYGGSHPDSHLSLHRKRRLGLAVILNSAQREIQIPHFHLGSTNTDFLNHKGEKKHFRIQSYTFVPPHWCTLKSLFSILLTRVLEYSPVMLDVNANRLSVTSTHCEFRQTVHAILFAAGCDWRLLVRWFTVQVAVGEGLHWTHPLPYPSLHLMLVDGQIKVLSLERNDTKWCAA